jgi:16S rRNA (cytidine1402-2'-O)-methyltransferase
VSGLPAASFVYLGFPPRKTAARRKLFSEYARDTRTLVLYESPHRLLATLRDAQAGLGAERRVAVANELTKLYESVWRGEMGEAIAYLQDKSPRGEYVIVIGGAKQPGTFYDDE